MYFLNVFQSLQTIFSFLKITLKSIKTEINDEWFCCWILLCFIKTYFFSIIYEKNINWDKMTYKCTYSRWPSIQCTQIYQITYRNVLTRHKCIHTISKKNHIIFLKQFEVEVNFHINYYNYMFCFILLFFFLYRYFNIFANIQLKRE